MFADFLTERFSERPRRHAVIAPSARCTYGELATSVQRWAHELDANGVEQGDVVGLEGDFTPATIGLFLALAQRAAIVVPERASNTIGRQRREGVAEVETAVRVDDAERVRIEPTGRCASHALYAELSARRHPGLVQFSSGTTGEPKAAVHDLSSLLMKFQVPRPALSSLAFLFFDHLGGINTMLHTLSNGATLVSTADRSPDSVCGLIEQHAVALLPATPTFLNLLLLSGAHRRHDLSSLKTISYGAEPMSDSTLRRLQATFPTVRLQQTYGMIELGVMRTKSRDDGSLWVKVGGEGIETRVVDGVLQVRSPSVLLGYLNALTPIDADGWFTTGDMVERHGDYLKFLGRQTDLINVGGEKVYPAEVEGVIESMNDVAEATVHGAPHGLIGQIVCARVTFRPTNRTPASLVREVKLHCRQHLERYKVPMKVEIIGDELSADRMKKSRRQ